MQSLTRSATCALVFAVAAGCASTKVTGQERLVNERLPRPGHIWVYDFSATAADVHAESALAGQYAEHATPQTAEQIATGRKVGAQIAAELVKQIRTMGLPGEVASAGTTPQVNDIVIRGHLLSIDESETPPSVSASDWAPGRPI
jgi:hypothetical protein